MQCARIDLGNQHRKEAGKVMGMNIEEPKLKNTATCNCVNTDGLTDSIAYYKNPQDGNYEEFLKVRADGSLWFYRPKSRHSGEHSYPTIHHRINKFDAVEWVLDRFFNLAPAKLLELHTPEQFREELAMLGVTPEEFTTHFS